MVSWGASVPWPGPGVGCFDPVMILHRMKEVFGPDLEFDAADLLAGHYERRLQSAAELGIHADSPAVVSAAKLVREVSPRYAFRLRVGSAAFVSGQADRYTLHVVCACEADFPEPARGRFVAFLRSLQFGQVTVEV